KIPPVMAASRALGGSDEPCCCPAGERGGADSHFMGRDAGRSSSRAPAPWTGSSRSHPPMPSYSLRYSVCEEGHPHLVRMASELVGVAGFEPAASSSRTQRPTSQQP